MVRTEVIEFHGYHGSLLKYPMPSNDAGHEKARLGHVIECDNDA